MFTAVHFSDSIKLSDLGILVMNVLIWALRRVSFVIHRNGGVQPTCLYLHVLLKLYVNKEIVFLAVVSMNSTVACYVIPLLLTSYYSGNEIDKN